MSNNQTISGTLDVTGATTLSNTLVVTSATTLNGSVYILGSITNGTNTSTGFNTINRATYINKLFKASGPSFTVDSASTFSKPAQFTSDVSFGKLVKFNAAVTFANFPTVPVAKISGLNMIPGNLGTAQNLDVSTNAVIGGKLDVSGNTLIRGLLDVSGGLDVSGASRFANDVSFIGQRVDICGNFYAQYPENSIPQTAIIGGVGSDQFTTDVSMSKTLNVDQAVTFGDKLTVKGDVSFNGQRIDVCGNFYAQYPPDSIPQSAIIGGVGSNVFTSDVIMNQSARVKDMLIVEGDASFNNAMKVNGPVNLQALSVATKATFNADVDICGNLAAQFVPGSIPSSAINGGVLPANTFTNDVTMNRSLIIGDMLTVLGDVSFNNGMKVNGPVNLQALAVTNKATFKDVDICGNFFAQYPPASIPPSAIDGGVLPANTFTNNVTMKLLVLNESAIVNDMLIVFGDASFNSSMKVNGPVKLTQGMSVTNKATFGDVDICGNLAAIFAQGSISPSAINGGVLPANTLTNDVTMKSLTVQDGLTSSGDILLRGPVTLQQGISVANKATFNSDVDICGNLAARFADGSISSTVISDGALSTRVFINDISLNKRLFVGENATFNENAYINKDLTVNGRLMVKQYTDSAIIRTTTNEYVVIVTEDLSVNGNIVIENSAKINSLTVLNDISTNGLLNVNGVGKSVFLDNVDICGNLTANFANDSIPLRAIPGLTDVVAKTTNAPNITEDVSLNKRLFVNGDISSGGLLFVNASVGDSRIKSNLTVDGFIVGQYNNDSIPINAVYGLNTAISNITNVNEDMTIGKRLFVTSDISSGGLLYVNGAGTSTIVGGLTVNGVLTAKYNVNDISSSVIKGLDASLNKIPNVFEDISLNKRLFVNSDISSGGLLHVNGVGTSVFLDNVDVRGILTANFANDSIPLTAIPGLTDVVAKTTNAPNITEDVSLNKRLFVNGDISSGGLLFVNASVGDSRIKSNLTVDGFIVGQYQPGSILTNAVNGLNASLDKIPNVLEDISLNKRLFVTSDISSGGLLYINGTGNSKITSGLIVGTLNADNITVSGSLTVNGTTTSLNTTNLGVKDSLIELSSGLTTGTNPINDSGILINRGNQNNVFMGWNETNKTFTLGETTATGTSTGGVNVTVGTLVAKLNSDLVDINGGTIDNTSVGSSVASSGKFTSIETSSDVSMNSRLFVGGDVTLNGRVDICGNLYAKYPQNSIPQSAIIGGVGSNSFSGDVLVEYKLAVTNDVSMNTKLSVGGDVSMNSKLSVLGGVTMNSNLSVGGGVTMNSRLLVDDDVSMNSRLYVKGETKLGGPTNCTSDIGVNGLTLGRGGGNISSNTAFGGGALQNNVSGSDNTAIGYSASLSNNTGSKNISIGSDAAKMCTSGIDNIAIGVQSLSINTGSQNIGIGTYAGLTQNSGTKNTFLGYYADSANGPHSNSTAIGAHAIITASNQITLGTETETVYVPGSTLLVGDVSMNTKLSVGGDVSMNTKLFVGGDVTLNGRVDICGNLFAKYPANSIPQTAIIGGVGSNSFSGDVLVEYKLAVTNDVSMNTKLSVGGDVSMNSKLLVVGDVSMNTKLSVGGDVSMNSKLSVGGDVSMNTKLSVGGDVSMNSKLLVVGDVSMNSKLLVGGDVSMNSKLLVVGDVSMNTKLSVGGDVSMNSKLSVGGDVSMNSKLSVGGAVILKDRVDICGNLYAQYPNDSIPQTAIIGGVGSNIFTADVSMNQKLSVGGDVSMNSKLYVKGQTILAGATSSTGDIIVNGRTLGRGPGNSSNYVFGFNSLLGNTSGENNIAIGEGVLAATVIANSNIGIGYSAGSYLNGGDANTFLGYGANTPGGIYTKSTAIGAFAQITASNQITLGTATETVNVPGLISVAGDIIMNGGSLRTTDSNETVTIFDTATTINLGGASTNINIGTIGSNATTVTIGANGDTVNILGNLNITGTTTTISAVNLDISDNAITLNKGGPTATFKGAGINIQENLDLSAGYIRVDDDRTRFVVKLPLLATPQYIATKDSANDLSANNFTTNGNFTMAGSGSLLMTGKYIKQF